MALPIDLVLVRHGESEGNAAKRLSEKGDDSVIFKLAARHTASFRLTPKGRRQALAAGKWLREEFYFPESKGGRADDIHRPFDRCITSEYFRAMETAGLLTLPSAKWIADFHIAERDWGALETFSDFDRNGRFAVDLARRDVEPFFWRPPHGETFAELCLRVGRMLEMLEHKYGDRVVVVCHGEVMRAFQVCIERLSQTTFRKLHFSQDPHDWFYNCQIEHYTRRNPDNADDVSLSFDWVRSIRPTENPVWQSPWKEIVPARYTNEELLALVHTVPSAFE